MKILTLDVGNTRTKYHLFKQDTLKSYGVLVNADQITDITRSFEPDRIGLSSVNPVKSDILINSLPTEYQSKLVRIGSAGKLNFELDYETPQTLGSDRICSMAGARSFSPDAKLLIAIDSGTCITVNILREGVFTGGIIAPGIYTMLRSMHEYTGALPLLEMYVPVELEGKNTNDSMMCGVVVYLSGIGKYISGIKLTTKTNPSIYITGGNGLYLKDNLALISSYEEHLVAIGIKTLTELNS
ncbi:MAG: type III pantothenate kinase [Ignavibacteriaceae bacterium]|nr:type III pantothenate kinase [Ignavibacteriaceae bacterium]